VTDEEDFSDLWRVMLVMDGDSLELLTTRDRLEPGRTFSEAAMSNLQSQLMTWIGTRVMRRWEATDEPPSFLRVTIQVDVG
jgi:hypothetical protein